MDNSVVKYQAIMWARNVLDKASEYVILDTETSNFPDKGGTVIQLGAMLANGQKLVNTLIKPLKPISPGAMKVHKITDEMVADAPDFKDVYPQLKEAIGGKKVIAYNSPFDQSATDKTCELHGLPKIDCSWECAMLRYADYYGEWNDYRGNYRWFKLVEAIDHFGIKVEDAHDALGDVLMTLKVIREMAFTPVFT